MNTMKSTIILFLTFGLLGCSSEPELTKDQLLRQSIEQLENKFEARKLGEIMNFVSEKYLDERGRKYKDVQRVIQLQLMRHKSVHVFSVTKDVQWTDDNLATVNITAAMSGSPINDPGILPTIRADMLNFTVIFILEDEVFKVQSATWTWASPGDFI